MTKKDYIAKLNNDIALAEEGHAKLISAAETLTQKIEVTKELLEIIESIDVVPVQLTKREVLHGYKQHMIKMLRVYTRRVLHKLRPELKDDELIDLLYLNGFTFDYQREFVEQCFQLDSAVPDH